jgi:UDPglucose 6-dehydrogenase
MYLSFVKCINICYNYILARKLNNTSILESVLVQLVNYDGIIISKCTAPPEFYAEQSQKLPNLVYSPELLRAAHAVNDYLNPAMTIFGGSEENCVKAFNILRESSVTIKYEDVILTDIVTASVFKYAANSFLAMKVIFANQLNSYCKNIGGNWNSLKSMLQSDTRLGKTHWDVPGHDDKYGGACFPKDVSALIASAEVNGGDFSLLEKVKQINEDLRIL